MLLIKDLGKSNSFCFRLFSTETGINAFLLEFCQPTWQVLFPVNPDATRRGEGMVQEISPNPLAMPDRSTVDGDRLGVDSKGHDTAKESEI